ncbi:heterokaryon incompatibility protein-domain-containing protein, partial [Boeremia exigua]|uniref:heterokaryon incompatibility protein-domain-containing protein n=1 Tax=Boeremia exigua TaxID=749465 RepID=UPI001E8E8343
MLRSVMESIRPTQATKLARLINPHRAITCATFSKDVPLDLNKRSVRFIEVLPDLSEDGLIQCTLSHGTVGDDEYMCLSYVWGSAKDIQQIMINGEQFPAQKNIWTFLNAARHAHQYPATARRLYWIDALCIDQGNIKERNHQVGHMGAIYAAARHVVIWMG